MWTSNERASAIALALLLAGCECAGEAPLATLVEHEGRVERAQSERWEPADDGDELRAGDGLRTMDGASAVLRLAEGRLVLEERTVVRLSLREGERGAARVIDVTSGRAILEADRRLEVQTPFGETVVEPGARMSLSGGDEPGLEVLFGRVIIGEDELVAGESLGIHIGTAQLEPELRGVRLVVRGTVRARRAGEWVAIRAESTVEPGTQLALEASARVTVRRGAPLIAVEGPAELSVGGPGAPLVTAGSGTARVEARGGEATLGVPGGRITAAGEGRADVSIDEVGTRVRAVAGRVRVVHAGAASWLERGEELAFERPPPLGPARAHLAAIAGESFTVHASRSPVVVELAVSHCPGEAVVEASGRRTRGTGSVRIPLEAGRHAYEVRCLGEASAEPVATGRISVRRDDGRAPLPELPPTAHVAFEGRPYTILFQGVLPRVVVSWRAGRRGPFTLAIERGGNVRERTSSTPVFDLPPGTLLQGTYVLRARDAGGASSVARVTLTLDDATPIASIAEPDDGGFAPGQSTRVDGVTQRGWTADVDGRALPLDRRRRFRGEASSRADRDALAIRLRHPRRGVHYYLRFARSP